MEQFFNRLKRTISRKHDYVLMHKEYEKTHTIMENASRKTWESAKAMGEAWCIKTGFHEGFDFLGLWPWRWISTLTGSRRYHQNFLDSYNFWVDELQQIVDEKDEKYQDGQSKIGFIAR